MTIGLVSFSVVIGIITAFGGYHVTGINTADVVLPVLVIALKSGVTIKVGVTSQADIIETFGGPNIATLDGSGNEMWVYDRHATVSYSKESGFSIGILGGAGGGDGGAVGGLGFGSRKSRSSQSSRSMTLIIKFDSRKIVSDFQSRSSSF